MSGTKYRGTALYVEWITAGGTTVLSAESRTFTVNEQSNQIDVTVRSDTAKAFLTDFPAITANMQGLDTAGTPTSGTVPQLWDRLNIGDTGTVRWSPEGTATGYRRKSMPAIVKGKNQEFPYDGVSAWTLDWDSNGGSVTPSTW